MEEGGPERAGAAGNPSACAGMRQAGAHRARNSALGQLRALQRACAWRVRASVSACARPGGVRGLRGRL